MWGSPRLSYNDNSVPSLSNQSPSTVLGIFTLILSSEGGKTRGLLGQKEARAPQARGEFSLRGHQH